MPRGLSYTNPIGKSCLLATLFFLCFPICGCGGEPKLFKRDSPNVVDVDLTILIAGQSNAANHAELMYATRYPQKVFTTLDGELYEANSPLPIASGEGGEWGVMLADKLVETGKFGRIMISSVAETASGIDRWVATGDLHARIENVRTSEYKPDVFIFHHGESDFKLGTAREHYLSGLEDLISTVRQINRNVITILGSSTVCGWDHATENLNPIFEAMKKYADKDPLVVTLNIDQALSFGDRVRDNCHLNQWGQIKLAKIYADTILKIISEHRN